MRIEGKREHKSVFQRSNIVSNVLAPLPIGTPSATMRRIATTSMAQARQEEAKHKKPAQEAVLIQGLHSRRGRMKGPRNKRLAVTGSEKQTA